MKVDTGVVFQRLSDVPAVAQWAEATGFDGLWTAETSHDPFLPLTLAAEHTSRIELGTAIAVAFPRSPLVLAQTAWDLAAQSNGRFILGLGTQVKAHIERRFGATWESPGPKLHELILALRAIWDCWQNGTRLNFRGRFYKLTLMTPFFNPGPIEHPHIPIYIAGVNPYLCRLAGQLCDGFHVHPFHSPRYLRERILPNVEAGLAESERTRQDIQLASSVFVVTGPNEAAIEQAKRGVREQIAFYASTPSYRPVLEVHGWADVGEQLSALAARKRWAEMPALITDEMLATFAVVAPPETLADAVRSRYNVLLDRVAYYFLGQPAPFDDLQWVEMIEVFHTDG